MNRDIRTFTISHLLTLTAVFAVAMAVVRFLGPRASFSLLLVAYGFAPTIAMLVIYLAKNYSTRARWLLGASTLFLLALAMLLHSGLSYGSEAIYFVALGTVIEWPGQIAVLALLHLLRQKPSAQLPSHHVDRWHSSDMPESFISVLELEPIPRSDG
jgi:hypothetical protein